jgi:hypothetical protein
MHEHRESMKFCKVCMLSRDQARLTILQIVRESMALQYVDYLF